VQHGAEPGCHGVASRQLDCSWEAQEHPPLSPQCFPQGPPPSDRLMTTHVSSPGRG
jgi:hypothetical protein